MKCYKCDHECPQKAKFCSICGSILEQSVVKEETKKEMKTEIKQELKQNHEEVQAEQVEQIEQHMITPPQPAIDPVPMQWDNELPELDFTQQKRNQQSGDNTNAPKKRKKLLLVCASIGLIAIIAIVVILIQKKSNHNQNTYNQKNGPDYVFDSNQALTRWLISDEELNLSECYTDSDGAVIQNYPNYVSSDPMSVSQKQAFIYTSLDKSRSICKYWSELFLYTDKGMEKIADHVIYCAISLDGTGIVYIINEENVGYNEATNNYLTGNLYLYDIETDKTQMIASNCYNMNISISPDGDSVAFITEFESKTDYKLCVSINGGSYDTIGSNLIPVAIGDEGKYIYYQQDQKIYVMNGSDQQCIASNCLGEYTFNYDYSEVLIKNEKEIVFYKIGENPQIIRKDKLVRIIVPQYVSSYYNSTGINLNIEWIIEINYGVKHLTNQLYVFDSGYYYLDSDIQVHKLDTGTVDRMIMSENGEKVIYSCEGNLYSIDLMDQSLQSSVIAKGIDTALFTTNSDLTDIYYRNLEGELMYIDDKGNSKMISDNTETSMYMVCNREGYVYFVENLYNDDKAILYYSKDGSDKEKITEADFILINIDGNNVYYSVDIEDNLKDIYMMKNETSIKVFDHKNVALI